jgi:hypothetical protein
VGPMRDQTDKFRKLASDCLAMAQTTTDPGTRIFLLTIGQRWHDLASGPAVDVDAVGPDFNDRQMSDHAHPIMQQQQQIQDKRD